MSKTILITGCSGYIGSKLTKRLHENHTIIGIDKKTKPEGTDDFYQVDFAEHQKKAIKQIYDEHDIDTVIHLAAEKT